MVKRWLRRAVRRCGIDLPFDALVCPEDVKTICVEPGVGATVTVRRTLVFLEVPEVGDLVDAIPETGIDAEAAPYESLDAWEVSRRRRGRSMLVRWRPRQAIVPYNLYSHEYMWRPPGSYGQPAQYTEVQCEMRTGVLALEMFTPGTFEMAVVFRRPRWRRLASERSVIKYALRALEAEGERPAITEYGKHLTWKVVGPKVGDRYICVVFHAHGVAQWKHRLETTSIVGRLRQLVRPLIPA
jgi:hypothetical protein